jgi:transposase
MPRQGVTEEEQRSNFIRDWKLGFYSVSELADYFGVSRKTAHKWINRFCEFGRQGFAEFSRRPNSSPNQTPRYIVE